MLFGDVVLFYVGAEVVLLPRADRGEQASKLFCLVAVIKVIFWVDGTMTDHREEGEQLTASAGQKNNDEQIS